MEGCDRRCLSQQPWNTNGRITQSETAPLSPFPPPPTVKEKKKTILSSSPSYFDKVEQYPSLNQPSSSFTSRSRDGKLLRVKKAS